MLVRDIMSTDLTVIDRNDDLLSVENLMMTKQLRHLPVIEDGDVVGIVSQRDLFKAAMSSTMGFGEKAQKGYLHSVRVKAMMVNPVITVEPDTTINAAIDLMLQKGIGCLPVVEAGKLVGMVTKTDLLRHLQTIHQSA
jgi:CBS domain-containing protein